MAIRGNARRSVRVAPSLALWMATVASCANPAPPPAPTAAASDSSPLRNPRLPDFSYAGYRMGRTPIPHVRAAVDAQKSGVKADGVTDDTRALAAALEATRDGALVLPAGRIVLRDALRITRSGVVVRGQGADRTILVIPESLADIHPEGDPLHGKLYGFIDARGADEGTRIAEIVEPSSRGARSLHVRWSPHEVPPKQGDVLRVRMGNADGLLRALLGGSLEPGPQTPRDYAHYVDWTTPVLAVTSDTLTLVRPLRVDVRPEWTPEILRSRPTLEEIGIEDLSIEFPGAARRAHDYVGPAAQSWAEEGFRAVYFRGVVNGWIQNVDVVDADDAIELEECRFCEVDDVRLRAVHRTAPSGHHGLWAKGAQDCLFSRFHVETQFADDVTVEAFANGNVFMNGIGEAINLDHHRNAPYENLFTDLDLGDGARLWNSGGDSNRGPHAGVRETLWNIRFHGAPPPLPGALHFDKRVGAGWPLLNLIRVPGYRWTNDRQNVWIDPAHDAPPNLYDAQRAARSTPRD